MKARPFMKWVGGKTQLLPKLLPLFPQKINTYYEPFIGGGAVFFALAAEGRFSRAVLNDWNKELVNVYNVIRTEPDQLIEQLKVFAADYAKDQRGAFENVRSMDRGDLLQHGEIVRAARMIFLNKTCFNGLYRVNKSGQFNAPFGKYTNPTICDEENIRACKEALSDVVLNTGDFEKAVINAGPGDVVYFDPPYVPVSATADFTSYTSDGFGMDDQYRLARLFQSLVEKGATVILSNSDTEAVRSLYEGAKIHSVQAKRAINSNASKRGPVGEVIVVGGPKTEEVLIEAVGP